MNKKTTTKNGTYCTLCHTYKDIFIHVSLDFCLEMHNPKIFQVCHLMEQSKTSLVTVYLLTKC